MRVSNLLMPTLREVPAEAEIVSHQLMLRAGLIRKLAAGVYSYLPLGLKTLRKIEDIIREEMDNAGAQELLMSALLPAESYMASGRWDRFGSEMFRLKDRNNRQFCLGPTHEEIFTQTVIDTVHSYRNYPITLYQIQTKYRDERRPRFGVMRTREFLMKDAYSFDISEEGLDKSYIAMREAYKNIFDRLALKYMIVDADSGAMGGSGSQEFMVISDVGEDTIAYCDACQYAANNEKAVCVADGIENSAPLAEIKKTATPNARTIKEVASFFGKDEKDFVKTLIYTANDKLYAVLVRGDREINETKLTNLLGGTPELAAAASVVDVTNAEVGFAGPVGLKIEIIADLEVATMKNFITGANETGFHFENVNINRDFDATVADIRTIQDGDKCPRCGKEIKTAQGIEVGHIFKLGTKYSDSLGLKFTDIEKGEEQSVIMGCYGIGVNRLIAAIIEQHNDQNGIIWPMSIAPYQVIVVPVKVDDEVQKDLAESIYNTLKSKGIEALIDDRDERPGVKFKDSELIGIPIRITVGKKAGEGIVEYKGRSDEKAVEKTAEQAILDAVASVKK